MKESIIVGMDGQPLSTPAAPYEGATRAPRSIGWSAPASGPNSSLATAIRPLRNRSRAAYRNSPLLRSAINKNTTNEVGRGFWLLSTCLDDDFRLAANKLWKLSSTQLDPEGVKNFGALLDLCVRSRRMSGEVFIRRLRRRLSSGLAVPIQVDVMESDLCPVEFTRKLKNGNRVVQGVEFKGKVRVAYWFYKHHPQDGVEVVSLHDLERVPASDVIHHFKQLRPGQVRGEPDPAAVLLKDRTFHDYDDAELVRKKERSNFTGFLYREAFDEDDFEFDPMTGKPIFDESEPVDEVSRIATGTLLRGVAGEKLDLFDGDNTGSGYSDFVRWQALQMAAGQEIPYPLLTGDWSGLNDRLVRAALNEYRRGIGFDQENLSGFQVAFKIWQWWLSDAVLVGKLDAPGYADNPYYYLALDIRPDAFKWLHPEQDVNTRQKAVSNQLSNIDVEAAEYGRDLDENMRRNAKALKRWQTICEEEGIEKPSNLAGLFNAPEEATTSKDKEDSSE